MFRGRYEHTIDAKGRTSVPARYREALSAAGERRVVLTSALDPCLVAYAPPEWAAFEERLGRLSQFDRAVKKLSRIYVSGAIECEIDDVGPHPRAPHAARSRRLKKDVLWAGNGNYAELWDKDHGSATSRRRRKRSRRSPRASRSSGYEQRAARPARPALQRARRRVGVERGRRRHERRQALRAHDRHARRGRAGARPRGRAASTSTRRWAAAATRTPSWRPSRRRASSVSTAIRSPSPPPKSAWPPWPIA